MYDCSLRNCGQTFTQKQNLIDHIRRCHLKEINYKCSYCEKSFFEMTEWSNHIVVQLTDHLNVINVIEHLK